MSRFAIGDGYACYRGRVTEGPAHRHAAFQIAVAARGELAMLDAGGACHRAEALVVPPMTWHQLLPAAEVHTYYVEPSSAFADRLRGYTGITPAAELRDLREEDVRRASARTSGSLDPRLVAAMDTTMAAWNLSMPELAERVGLSPQRLRALARRELGMPLTRWRVWMRLGRAAEAMRDGRSVSEAAAIAGFADQAHMTRWMREMMGLTPSAARSVLLGGR